MVPESGSGDGRRENEAEGSRTPGLEQLLDLLILQIETVSSHFSYTEEYVMQHTPWWLNRKFKQAQREKWNTGEQRVTEHMRSIMSVLDIALNKGKGLEEVGPKYWDEAQGKSAEKETEVEKNNEKFTAGQWWKGEAK